MTTGKSVLPRLAAVFVLMATPLTAAWAQELNLNALIQRLDRIDRDLASVQRLLANEGVPASALEAPAPTGGGGQFQGDEWEEQIRFLTGQVEEARYELRQLTTDVTNATADYDARLAAIEQELGISGAPLAAAQPRSTFPEDQPEPANTTTTVVGGDPNAEKFDSMEVLGTVEVDSSGAAIVPPSADTTETAVAAATEATAATAAATPEQQYDQAYRLLAQTDYAAAETALQSFIEDNPDHQLTGNAYYWLGETFYVRNDFRRAAVAFAKGYKGFPQGAKAADNLLKLGMSFAAMEKTAEACATYDKLSRDHGDASSLILDRLARERGRASCA
jgi:tol-pal system protein YbgF